jgi:hypothetical protein
MNEFRVLKQKCIFASRLHICNSGASSVLSDAVVLIDFAALRLGGKKTDRFPPSRKAQSNMP